LGALAWPQVRALLPSREISMPVDKSVVKDLNKVIDKLTGWLDTAAGKAEKLSGADAVPWENMRDNYQDLINQLDAIIQKITTEVVEVIE